MEGRFYNATLLYQNINDHCQSPFICETIGEGIETKDRINPWFLNVQVILLQALIFLRLIRLLMSNTGVAINTSLPFFNSPFMLFSCATVLLVEIHVFIRMTIAAFA